MRAIAARVLAICAFALSACQTAETHVDRQANVEAWVHDSLVDAFHAFNSEASTAYYTSVGESQSGVEPIGADPTGMEQAFLNEFAEQFSEGRWAEFSLPVLSVDQRNDLLFAAGHAWMISGRGAKPTMEAMPSIVPLEEEGAYRIDFQPWLGFPAVYASCEFTFNDAHRPTGVEIVSVEVEEWEVSDTSSARE